jgi:hypothetical protein
MLMRLSSRNTAPKVGLPDRRVQPVLTRRFRSSSAERPAVRVGLSSLENPKTVATCTGKWPGQSRGLNVCAASRHGLRSSRLRMPVPLAAASAALSTGARTRPPRPTGSTTAHPLGTRWHRACLSPAHPRGCPSARPRPTRAVPPLNRPPRWLPAPEPAVP